MILNMFYYHRLKIDVDHRNFNPGIDFFDSSLCLVVVVVVLIDFFLLILKVQLNLGK